ncbi:hypothetical protein ACFVT5_32615 [Streptomyces sp. NPDC058001]|uniref:hypothetical protein n=1 Tax=Streptomyces sp. NPDC058001 TaxID=3346300 RepID=UPI0036E778EA
MTNNNASGGSLINTGSMNGVAFGTNASAKGGSGSNSSPVSEMTDTEVLQMVRDIILQHLYEIPEQYTNTLNSAQAELGEAIDNDEPRSPGAQRALGALANIAGGIITTVGGSVLLERIQEITGAG